jgi:hypothetical protein
LLELSVESFPFLVKVLSVLFILFYCELLLLVSIHPERFLKSEGIDFLQDGLQSDE